MTISSSDRRFNWVVVTDPLGTQHRLSRDEFEAMRLDERVRALLHKRIRFFVDDEEIPVKEAMSAHG